MFTDSPLRYRLEKYAKTADVGADNFDDLSYSGHDAETRT